MSTEMQRVIAEALAGVGEGIAGLRASGESVALVACSIEIEVDDAGSAARMSMDLGSRAGAAGVDSPSRPATPTDR